MATKPLWGAHAGRQGEFDSLFRNDNIVGLAWSRLGDLRSFGHDRSKIQTTMHREYPNTKPGALPGYAAMFSWFVQDIQNDDYVLYPRKADRTIHIGQFTGPYTFAGASESLGHRRAVRWLKSFSRDQFGLPALREASQGGSFFKIANYADEFLGALSGNRMAAPSPEEFDPGEYAQEEEEVKLSTEDFVLSRLFAAYKGKALEDLIANLFRLMGYHTQQNPEGPSGQYDIRASRGILGIEPPILKIECKSSENEQTGVNEVGELLGQLGEHEYAVFIALKGFTPNAKALQEKRRADVRLMDGTEVVALILQHYEQLEPRHKAAIPLKRVYIPDVAPAVDPTLLY